MADVARQDRIVVERQVGRAPRGDWRVARRCSRDRPALIATAPSFEGGEPFPTLFWLTCPWLCGEVARLESAGGAAKWTAMLSEDDALAARMREADAEYRRARREEGGGEDPCGVVGVAGGRDPLRVKCLHAHVAAALAGLPDPVGAAVLDETGRECGTMPGPCRGDEG